MTTSFCLITPSHKLALLSEKREFPSWKEFTSSENQLHQLSGHYTKVPLRSYPTQTNKAKTWRWLGTRKKIQATNRSHAVGMITADQPFRFYLWWNQWLTDLPHTPCRFYWHSPLHIFTFVDASCLSPTPLKIIILKVPRELQESTNN